MSYLNKSAYWGDIDAVVTPQWYAERAAEMQVPYPDVIETRDGLKINGETVASHTAQEA